MAGDIDATLSRSPGFFLGKPVVLDLSTVDLSGSAITHLVMSLEKRSIRVLGIEGCEAARLTQNMPPLLTGGRHAPVQQVESEKPEVKPPPNSLLLDSPVRSGQSIVFPDGDVTVVGSVGSARKSSPAAPSMSTARCVAARWPASAMRRRGLPSDGSRAARDRRLLPDRRRNFRCLRDRPYRRCSTACASPRLVKFHLTV
jgi:hypothetical protein